MKSLTREILTDEFIYRVKKTLNKKGNDYASDDDAFSNFTNTALLLKIPTEKVFIAEISKKCSRIVELLSKETACESMLDSVLDIAGYACLLDNYLRGVAKETEGVANEEKSNQGSGSTVGQVN